MSGRAMTLDVLVRLKDRLSGPLRKLKDSLKAIGNAARSIGVVGTAIAAISFLAPIKEAAAFEQKLIDIALTQNMVGDAVTKNVKLATAQYEALALAIGQTSDTVASGAGQMIAAGVSGDLVDASIGVIGRAATAANTEFSDMAAASTALLTTLKVPAGELEGALSALVVAGKQGSFELKDMAQYFPQLTGQVAKFGLKGRDAVNFLASALQIAKKGTSDPSAAANNLQNFLSKALAPLTIKNFREMGVDIESVMKDAVAKGINPIEAMLQKVGKLTGVSEKQIQSYMGQAKKRGLEGAEALGYVREQLEGIGAASAISELFADQQVLDFLIPFLANVDEYKDIKATVAAATGAAIDQDFESQMKGLNRQLNILGEIGTQAVRSVGFAFGTWLPMINAWLMSALRWVRELDASTGGWVSSALVAAGGAVLLVGALGALGLALPIVGAGLAAIGAVALAIVSPVGLLIAGLAAGAVYVGRNWDRFGPRLVRLWERSKQAFRDFAGDVVDRGRRIVASGRELVGRYGPAIRDGIGRAWSGVKSFGISAFADGMERLARVKDGAIAFFNAFGNGFGNGFRSAFEGDPGKASASAGALALVASVFERLRDVAMGGFDRVQVMFDTVGRFLSGFAGEGSAIGKGFGNVVAEISRGMETISKIIDDVGAIGARMTGGIDWKALLGDGAEALGSFIGREIAKFAEDLAGVARSINWVLEAIQKLTSWLASGEPIDWGSVIPKWVADTATNIASAIETVIGKIEALKRAMSTVPWGNLFNGGFNSSVAPGTVNPNPLEPYMGPVYGPPSSGDGAPSAPANSNKQSSYSPATGGSSKFAALSAPVRQDVNVGGTVRIAVEGPGKVVGATSDNSRVALGPDRGRAVGRA